MASPAALESAGVIIWNDGSVGLYGNGEDPGLPDYTYVRETDSGSRMAMIHRDLFMQWLALRYPAFDFESYVLHDLAMWIRSCSKQVIYQPEAIVYLYPLLLEHVHSMVPEKFLSHWKPVLENRHLEKFRRNMFMARERGQDRKYMLMIDYMVPLFDKDAGSRTMKCYIDLFLHEGYLIKYVSDFFYPAEKYLQALKQKGVEVLHGRWYEANLEHWFNANGYHFSLVFLSRPTMAIKYLEMVKKHVSGKILFYGHDLHHLRLKRQYELEKRDDLLKEANRFQEIERKIFDVCDVIYYPSPAEIDFIVQEYSLDKPARAIVPYIFSSFTDRKIEWDQRQGIMFIGGFLHPPNVDAVRWFMTEIWPLVQVSISDMHFYIVGSDPPDDFKKYNTDHVHMLGYVSDQELDKLYNLCKMVVAPLRYGAGIKGKIVEAMYHGLPVITTTIGAEGLIGSQEILQVSDDPAEFARLITDQYHNEHLLDNISRDSVEYVRSFFSESRAASVIRQDLDGFDSNVIKNYAAEGVYLFKVSDVEDYRRMTGENHDFIQQIREHETLLSAGHQNEFYIHGFCHVCHKEVDFLADFSYSFFYNEERHINFPERMVCPVCGLNGRTRAAFQLLTEIFIPDRLDKIYINEQVTRLFTLLSGHYQNIIGSEFLFNQSLQEEWRHIEIRNEDLTALSFHDESFNAIISFDCFEHIHNYKSALREIYRCLKKGGSLIFSVPFYPANIHNIVRAIVDEHGITQNLLPEEYHGNPLSREGSLCYYNFGWRLVEEVKGAGFVNVESWMYWSRKYGYLGGLRTIFRARK
jgi:glycosyltransferase involved in cell wall biosynthesis